MWQDLGRLNEWWWGNTLGMKILSGMLFMITIHMYSVYVRAWTRVARKWWKSVMETYHNG